VGAVQKVGDSGIADRFGEMLQAQVSTKRDEVSRHILIKRKSSREASGSGGQREWRGHRATATTPGGVEVGGEMEMRDNLGVVMVRPRRDFHYASFTAGTSFVALEYGVAVAEE
jgi:hypothetical protein